MSKVPLFLFSLSGAALAAEAQQPDQLVQSPAPYANVIRIQNASQTWDYGTPWNAGRFGRNGGTGWKVGPNQFVTNAHVVSASKQLVVFRYGDPTPYAATIEHIAHDCDLALLSLEDAGAFADIAPLEIGDVPALESEVRVIGYPVGGQRISVTRGVVSRIDFSTYSHSGIDQHLVVQVDAAINPGNSGGPVLQDGKVVGVAFQGLRSADNTGYIIPTPVLKRFLADIEDGSYDYYVELGISEFALLNPAQRQVLNLPNNRQGVLVTSVAKGASAYPEIQEGDVLLYIDGFEISAGGKISLDGEKVNFNEVVERKFEGDTVTIGFLRNGQPMSEDITLHPFKEIDFLKVKYEERPRYVLFAGLLFQPLERNLYTAYSFRNQAIRKIFADYIGEELYNEYQDVVILTKVLPDALTSEIAGFAESIVEEINDQPVRSLTDVYLALNQAMVDGQLDEFVKIKVRDSGRPIILRSAEIQAAHERVMAQYGIPVEARLSE
ncbi:MAG: trypsin-like peptidase domain-containing protein [Verrucomicrobiota bacterium]